MTRFALLPGDGIGREVTVEVEKALAFFVRQGLPFKWKKYDFCADTWLDTGSILSDETFSELKDFDAIFLGAFGDPRIPDSRHAREVVLRLRFDLDLYVNLRPIKLLADNLTALKGRKRADIDFIIVRENTEGVYVGSGGFLRKGTPHEVACQEAIATRMGVDRILRYAFHLAEKRDSHRLVMADKHNALKYVSDLWFRAFEEIAPSWESVQARHLFVDNLCCQLILDPSAFDVIVTGNLFGDIVSDLGAGLVGGLGVVPSANLNPETGIGVFEPAHGSAPDIAGKGIANPVAALLSAAMMLDFAGFPDEAESLKGAVEEAIAAGQTTRDLGGELGTSEVGDAVIRYLEKLAP